MGTLIYLIGVIIAYLIVMDFVSFSKKTIDRPLFSKCVLVSLFSWLLVVIYIFTFVYVYISNKTNKNEGEL